MTEQVLYTSPPREIPITHPGREWSDPASSEGLALTLVSFEVYLPVDYYYSRDYVSTEGTFDFSVRELIVSWVFLSTAIATDSSFFGL